MGLTTQYHKYLAAGIFNVIASTKSNIVWLTLNGSESNQHCAVGACENVIVWDTKTQKKIFTLYGTKHEVFRLAASPQHDKIAVGYFNGVIKIFSLRTQEEDVSFSGHRTAISALTYDTKGMLLISGSWDTDIIVWDIVSESGMYRLKGHKGLITDLVFLNQRNIIMSSTPALRDCSAIVESVFIFTSSKDTFVKFWDMDTQHCFRTLTDHKTEVYGLAVNAEEDRLYTGGSDNLLRVYALTDIEREQEYKSESKEAVEGESNSRKRGIELKKQDDEEEHGEDEEIIVSCKLIGTLERQGRGRTVGLHIDRSSKALACHGTDKGVELFGLLNVEERETLLSKRASKARKRARNEGAIENTNSDETKDEGDVQPASAALTVEDELKRHEVVWMPQKAAFIDIRCQKGDICQVVSLQKDNSIHTVAVDLSNRRSKPTHPTLLSLHGHRKEVRALTFSNDGGSIASASATELKVWNRDSLQCVRTMPTGYGLCCAFLPGDRHVVVGCQNGSLQLFDLAANKQIENIEEAHEGALWSLCINPDKKGMVTGGADQQVKFWQFELIDDDDEEDGGEDDPRLRKSQRLTITPTKVLKMSDDVLCIKISSNNKFLAVSLLDNTIKVFFMDSLKFFLSLYGHSLPALSIDISTDCSMLVSGSADKNIKIWGMDFGDCHRSIFAHNDNVMGVSFVPKTHLIFSCGKDGQVKQWDGDNFQHITTLEPPHHGHTWAVTTSPEGMAVISSGSDFSLRMWEKTDEILVLEEQREEEREAEFEAELEREENPVIPGEVNTEIAFATKKTIDSIKATEKIMEAVDLWRSEKDADAKNAHEIHPILRAFECDTPQDFVLMIIRKIKSSEVEESLLVLPFDYAMDLLRILDDFIIEEKSVELVSRCVLFLMKVHHNQITANSIQLDVIAKLKSTICTKSQSLKDRIGFNMMALQLLALKLEDRQGGLWADATKHFEKKQDKRGNQNKKKGNLLHRRH